MVGSTMRLIGEWSMDGAHGDLGSRFRSALDVLAVVSARSHEPNGDVAPPVPAPLLLKPAGEDDWRPLLVGDPA